MDSPQTQAPIAESQFEQPSQPEAPRSQVWVWTGFAMLLLASGFLLGRVLDPDTKPQPAVAQSPQAPPPRPVETVALATGNATRSLELLGQVEASQQSVIRAQTSGVVQEILVQSGDAVSQGTPIVILEDSDQQLAISQAQAQAAQQRSNLARLEVGTRPEIIAQRQAAVRSAQAREQEARDNYNRTSLLVKEGALSQRLLVEARSRVDDAVGERLAAAAALAEAEAGPIPEEIEAQRANLAAAQTAVQQAELAQQRTRILAVEAGTVQRRHVSRGDLVESGDEIVTLVTGNALDIFLELPEAMTGQVTPGMEINLSARALPQWQQRTTITAVVPAADAASRRQRVRVQIDTPPAELVPGMAIVGKLTLPSDRRSFVVSRDALTRRQDQWLVFAIADGKAQQIPVEMVADLGRTVAIASPNLRSGQRIVSRGGDGLQNGAAVKVVDRPAKP
jgi:RND family efflux transporter MFP subunit